MMETGQAPFHTEIATELGMSAEEGRQALHDLFGAGVSGWLFPDTDYIASFAPFSNLLTQCGRPSGGANRTWEDASLLVPSTLKRRGNHERRITDEFNTDLFSHTQSRDENDPQLTSVRRSDGRVPLLTLKTALSMNSTFLIQEDYQSKNF